MPATGNKLTYHNLSIRVKADGFSFIITEGLSGDNLLCLDYTVSDVQQLPAELAQRLCADEISQYEFSRVRVTCYTDATFIPQQEFSSEDLTNLYHVVFPSFDESKYMVSYTHLPQLDIVVAFILSSAVRKAITDIYPEASFTNASAVVLGRIATFYKRQNLPDNALFAYATPFQLFLFSVAEGKLQFANSYSLDQPKDSLYYLLSAWKVLEFNARRNYCYLAGEDGSVEYLFEETKKYLQNVAIMSLSIEG